jgi:hypothetical protein
VLGGLFQLAVGGRPHAVPGFVIVDKHDLLKGGQMFTKNVMGTVFFCRTNNYRPILLNF